MAVGIDDEHVIKIIHGSILRVGCLFYHRHRSRPTIAKVSGATTNLKSHFATDNTWFETERPIRYSNKQMLQILKDCLQGKLPNRTEAHTLSALNGEELQALITMAGQVRDRHKGRVVTFSPKVFVPLTNLCRDFCGYCTFRKAPDEIGAKTMTLDEVLRVVRQGKLLGCTEVLFSLGDRPEAIYPEMKEFLAERGHRRTLDYLREACRAVLEEAELLPHSNPGVMGRGDLQRLKEVNVSLGLMLESISERLLWPGAAHDNAPD